jgi:hypothetical protein
MAAAADSVPRSLFTRRLAKYADTFLAMEPEPRLRIMQRNVPSVSRERTASMILEISKVRNRKDWFPRVRDEIREYVHTFPDPDDE